MIRTLHVLLPLIVACGASSSAAHAHVLDEYLQSTLVAIEPGDIRLHINLTPGVEVADKVLAQIDQDRDGVISSAEAAAYADRLKRELIVRLDGHDSELKLTELSVPALAELHTGHGIIQMEFSVKLGSFTAGLHRLAYENRHFGSLGAYLFNAARPRSASIQIARQNRNANQSTGEIEFAYDPPSHPFKAPGLVPLLAVLLFVMCAAVWRIRRSSPSYTARIH